MMLTFLVIFQIIVYENLSIERIKSDSKFTYRITFGRDERVDFVRLIQEDFVPDVSYRILKEHKTGNFDKAEVSEFPITVSAPFEWLGKKFFPVRISNLYKSSKGIIRIEELELSFQGKPADLLPFPRPFRILLQGLLLNKGEDSLALPGGVIFVVPDRYDSAIQPLLSWKQRKGYSVKLVRVNSDTLNNVSLRNHIINLWNTLSLRPEFVVLVGGIEDIPAFNIGIAGDPNPTDQFYGMVDNDFIPEMLVGRLDVENSANLLTLVKKIIRYETNPELTDTMWFRRALVIGANYPEFMNSPVHVKKRIRREMLYSGFLEVDTAFYDPSSGTYQTVVDISNSVNRGVAFVNYRGGIARQTQWDYPLFSYTDVFGLANGWKLPVITSIVCNTGAYQHPACFGRKWIIAGDTINPKGAVAFYGASSPQTHTRWNNCMDFGFYSGLLSEGINILGSLVLRSKIEVMLNFYEDNSDADSVMFQFLAFNLLGDPTLEVWTEVPKNVFVEHPANISLGTSFFTVRVKDFDNSPLKNAVVTLFKKGEVQKSALTDCSGYVSFLINANTPDTLFITVTAKNRLPYLGYTTVSNSSCYLGYYSHIIMDSLGDGNGEVNPGETIAVYLSIRNYGMSQTASNVVATISSSDPKVRVLANTYNYGQVAPGEVKTGGPFIMALSGNAENGRKIKLDVQLISNQGNFNFSFGFEVKAPFLQILNVNILDANGILEPGENSSFAVNLKNSGAQRAMGIFAVLRTGDKSVTIVDSTGYFGNIEIDSSNSNVPDPFRVNVSSSVYPGRVVPFTLYLRGERGFEETVSFEVTIGNVTPQSVYGPDLYGYYAYEDLDSHPNSPSFQWIEIDPFFGGSGTILNLGDEGTVTIRLPFTFRFYGVDYDTITICSNGYILMGKNPFSDQYNWLIPSRSAPPAIIAPFWTDLNPVYGGRVCYYYDSQVKRSIVEWSRVYDVHNPFSNPSPGEPQTFQVILFDPRYYPTPSGDGIILYQYLSVVNNDFWHKYATIGIQDHTQTMGLLYTYNNQYPPACSTLTNGRAIKFTTSPPDNLSDLEENVRIDKIPVVKLSGSYLNIKEVGSNVSEIVIFDVSGRNLINLSGSEIKKNRLFVGKLPKGVYFVRLKVGDIKYVTKIMKFD